MKIAYGTYAMPTVPLEKAFPILAQLGYDGVEICSGPRHPGSLPDQADPVRRAALRGILREHGLEIPAMMIVSRSVLGGDAEAHRANLEHAREVAQLARDLGAGETPIVSMGLGGKTVEWEALRGLLVERLGDYAARAAEDGFVLAGEAHVGAAVDRAERALWLFRTVDRPSVGLHFDIAHFFLAGERVEDSVRALLPITVHTHITGARRLPDGRFDLLLPGEGDLDIVAYLRAMHQAGWTGCITLEISARVWSKHGYDPLEAAAHCYRVTADAFAQAGVPRG